MGRHLVHVRRIPRASYGCFNPYVSFGDRSHLYMYIIDYFSIICICDLSNRMFQFDLLVCGHLVSSNATIKKYHTIFLNCKVYNGNKQGQYPITCEACE